MKVNTTYCAQYDHNNCVAKARAYNGNSSMDVVLKPKAHRTILMHLNVYMSL